MKRYMRVGLQVVMGVVLVVLAVMTLALRSQVQELESRVPAQTSAEALLDSIKESDREREISRIERSILRLRDCLGDLSAGSIIGGDVYSDAVVEDLAFAIRQCAR